MQKIEHPKYGHGEILKKLCEGFELIVEFKDKKIRTVRGDEIQFIEDRNENFTTTEKQKIAIKSHKNPIQPIDKQFEACRIITALRWGVIPRINSEIHTFGRENEINQIKNWLRGGDEKNGTLIITGGYGEGKSHFLEYSHNLALNNNWAVSIVELDTNENTMSKPKQIYETIIQSFKYKSKDKEKDGSFRDFLREIAEKDENFQFDHPYFEWIIDDIRSDEEHDEDWDAIEGKIEGKNKINGCEMPDTQNCANIYCYILSGISWAAKNILGLDGFLIFFDEADNLLKPNYYINKNSKAIDTLRGFILTSNNDSNLINEFEKEDFYTERKSGVFNNTGLWGELTDLQYYKRSLVPYLWQPDCNLKIILAIPRGHWIFKNEPETKQIRDIINKITPINLQKISEKDLKKCYASIESTYLDAYGFKAKINFFEEIPKDNIRKFVKGTIEKFDISDLASQNA